MRPRTSVSQASAVPEQFKHPDILFDLLGVAWGRCVFG
jgi:hypothetical protein